MTSSAKAEKKSLLHNDYGSLKKQKTRKMFFSSADQFSRMERYEELDKNHPLNRKFQGDAQFRGPIWRRKHTDWYCQIVFLVITAGFFGFGVIAYLDGYSARLTRGTDFRGEICGIGDLTSRPYLYYPSPTIDLNVRFCVTECPTTSGQLLCLYDTNSSILTPFCYTQVQSATYGRFCLPVEPINKALVNGAQSTFNNLIKRMAGDIGQTFDVLVAGMVLIILMSYLCSYLLKIEKAIKFVVWSAIWGTLLSFGLFAYFFYREYRNTIDVLCIQQMDKHNCGGNRALIFKIACFSCIGVFGFYMFIFARLFNRINLGIGILQSVSRCALVMNQIKWIPWMLMLFALGIGAYFILAITQSFSIGELEVIPAQNIDGGYVKIFVFNDLMRVVGIACILVFQWWMGTILLYSDSITSFSVSTWFFEKRKETVVLPVKEIVRCITKYHMGTITMLAIFRIIFSVPNMILGVVKEVLTIGNQNSDIQRFAQNCCLCCMHFYLRFLRYVNKHLIVQMCMWSASFMPAAKRAYFLRFRNSDVIQDMDLLTVFLLFQIKLCCALVGAIFVHFYVINLPVSLVGLSLKEVETPIVPTFVVLIFGFFFASILLSSADIASKTVLQCYLIDCEMFVGEQRYVEARIKAFMEYYRKTLEEDERTIFKNQVYIKGMKHARPGQDMPEYVEEDPDDDENRKFDKEIAKSSSEDESHEQDDDDEDADSDQDDADSNNGDFVGDKKLIIQKPGDDIQLFPEMPMQVNVLTPGGGKVVASNNYSDDEEDDGEDDDEAYANSKKDLRLSSAGSVPEPHQGNTPSSRSKLIEKNSEGGKGFKGDAPSVFNRSRLRDSTMKLDYDDDGENEMKYRL